MNLTSTNNYIFGRTRYEWAEFNYLNTSEARLKIYNNNSSNYIFDWGDGTIQVVNNDTTVLHNYSSPYTGVVKVALINGDLSNVERVTGPTTGSQIDQLNWSDAEIRQFENLKQFKINSHVTSIVSGDFNNLQESLEVLEIISNSLLHTYIIDISNLPSNIKEFVIFHQDATKVTGDITNLTTLYPLLERFRPYGQSEITGDISTLSSLNLVNFDVRGDDTTLYGSVTNLPIDCPNLERFIVYGMNTMSGNISNFNNLTSLTDLVLSGNNTISGNLNTLPNSLLTTLRLEGLNSITGDIASIGNNNFVNIYINSPNCTCYGNISEILDSSSLLNSTLSGTNTSFNGTINDINNNFTGVSISGSGNELTGYTSGKNWGTNKARIIFEFNTGFGLNSTELDNLIIDISNISVWINEKTFTVSNPDATRTAASDAAIATLISNGVTVSIT